MSNSKYIIQYNTNEICSQRFLFILVRLCLCTSHSNQFLKQTSTKGSVYCSMKQRNTLMRLAFTTAILLVGNYSTPYALFIHITYELN